MDTGYDFNMHPFRTINVTLLCWAFLHSLSAAEIRVPDDHIRIQEAIDAAGPGDRILVSPGNYRETIVLKPGIHIRSIGSDERGKHGLKRAEATIIDGGGESGGSPGVTMAEGATLDGFTVTGVGRYDAIRWQKHWDEKGENQSHEHIGHFGTPGIAIIGVTCTVINNVVHHNGDTGIAIRGVEGQRCVPIISGNVCYRNMGGGIGSMNDSMAVIERNACFENFFAGIGHNGASPLVIRNECYRNIRAGIGISEGAKPTVRKNRCYENRRAGIGIRTGEATSPLIEDNDCHDNEMAGIGCDEKATPIIRRNRCYRNKLAGIGCQGGSSPVIIDNHCHENEAAGIGADSANPLILRNHLEKNHTAGIGIRGESKTNIVGNTCLDNRLVAVGIRDGAEAFLQGNVLVRATGMPPMIAILGDSKAVLSGNTIRGGGIAGVMVEGRLDAIANHIEGQNGGSGILLKENSNATLAGNQISGFRVPINDQNTKPANDRDQSEDPEKKNADC